MTVLQALNEYFDRMVAREEAEDLGFTRENISYGLSICTDGTVRDVIDLRSNTGDRLVPRKISVPRPKRTSNIKANFLWDKTAYAFGVGKSKRLSAEHEEFKCYHRDMLAGVSNRHAKAFLSFLDLWTPEKFAEPQFKNEMLNSFFVFRLEDEHLWLHEIRELRALWLETLIDPQAPKAVCLVTGQLGPIETGHPVIKGVRDAHTSGAYLVSFNDPAYTSYNKPKDASNAPVSKIVAARYGAALNGLLERTSRNRLQRPIGDATIVFWADSSSAVKKNISDAAEQLFAGWFDPPDERETRLVNGDGESAKLRDALVAVAEGRPARENIPNLAKGVRFHVLGLAAPSRARLTVRYWLEDDFQIFACRLRDHYDDLHIEPPPWGSDRLPALWRLLVEATTSKKGTGQDKFKNVSPLLAGEMMRAILGGLRYPRTMLSAAIIRLRAGDDPATGWHAAAIRAVLARDHRLNLLKEDAPVSLDKENSHAAYQLGRMFAVVEAAQRMALGKTNSTVRDRYFGAASATPASIFPLLWRGAQNHLGKLRKDGKGAWIERELEEIGSRLPSALPRSLGLEAQGRFVIGYYHQRQAQFAGRSEDKPEQEGEGNDK